MQRPIISVSEINKYIKDILSNNIILSNVLVRGEISNLKSHYSGHMYFTLKDEISTLKCVMFKTSCMNLKFVPQDGMKVIIDGKISVYERDGNYQLYVNDMQPDGVGALHIAFEQLKLKLEKEGLFNQIRKKQIPLLPQAVGVVTSPTGAAIRDILNIISRRFYNMRIIIYPVQVQGEGAASEIAKAIDNFNILNNVDVIIIGRGGGSIEELWAFNEEIVARSIAKSDIPIISAVGHETDYTIADFVSDLRAPTPSAAAELAVPNKNDIKATLNGFIVALNYYLKNLLIKKRSKLDNLKNSRVLNQPLDKINEKRLLVDSLSKGLMKTAEYTFTNKRHDFENIITKLAGLNPINVLKRGYCISSLNSKTIKSVEEVSINDKIKVNYIDGNIECSVIEVKK